MVRPPAPSETRLIHRLPSSARAIATTANETASGGVKMSQYSQYRQYEDLLIDALLDYGFTLYEAERLIVLQERIEREQRDQEQERQTRAWLGPDSRYYWN